MKITSQSIYKKESMAICNRLKLIIWGVLILSLFGACDAFFEENIEDDLVRIVVPANGVESDIATQVFMWEDIAGADSFRVQIVTPNFETTQALLADTIVVGTQFSKTLFPGTFSWRVKGMNTAYETKWSVAEFTIIDTDDLIRQSVLLLSPSDAYEIKSTDQILKWELLYNATNYVVSIYKDNWNETPFNENDTTETNQLSIVLTEGTFWWGVKAINDLTETYYSKRKLIVDLTKPVKPTLKTPLNKKELTDSTVTLNWISSDVNRNYVLDSIFIFNDVELKTLAKVESTIEKSLVVELDYGKTYYWRVRSSDKAKNISDNSDVYEFSISDKK